MPVNAFLDAYVDSESCGPQIICESMYCDDGSSPWWCRDGSRCNEWSNPDPICQSSWDDDCSHHAWVYKNSCSGVVWCDNGEGGSDWTSITTYTCNYISAVTGWGTVCSNGLYYATAVTWSTKSATSATDPTCVNVATTKDGLSYQKGYSNNHVQLGNIAWNQGKSACCDDPTDNVNHNRGCVNSVLSGVFGTAILTGYPGADKYSTPYYAGWLECDAYPTNYCNNICGGETYVYAGESGVGEYQTGSVANGGRPTGVSNDYGYKECCGDDAGENYRTDYDWPNERNGGMDWIGNRAVCCNAADMVDYDSTCVTIAGHGGAVATGAPNNDIYASPYSGGWLDCDSSSYPTNYCSNICEGGYVTFGETGFGEHCYNAGGTTSFCNQINDHNGCCGDDAGEFYVDSGPGPATCCNDATDCVDMNGNCKPAGGCVELCWFPSMGISHEYYGDEDGNGACDYDDRHPSCSKGDETCLIEITTISIGQLPS